MCHTQSHGNIIVYGIMKFIEENLPKSHFYRIHRSYVVNRSFIEYLEGNQAVLKEERLPLGESYKEEFLIC